MYAAMKRVEYDGKIIIFLDHRALFNDICKKHTAPDSMVYKLKAELFAFHPRVCTKVLESDHDMYNISGAKKNRKRKATAEVNNDFNTKLQHFCDGLLKQLKCEVPASPLTCDLPLIRCWEENAHADFPTLHGANETNTFHIFQHGQQKYVIPPHCRFYNHNVLEITKLLPQLSSKYDFICLDPPWKNKYIRRIKRVREQLSYPMLENSQLRDLPIAQFVHHQTLVAIWCTNSKLHQDALCNEFLAAWNLRLIHSLKWIKLNTNYELISSINAVGQKQPFEMLYIACHRESTAEFASDIKNIELLLSVPSIVHSHKPPLLSWLRPYLPTKQPKCLEIFARYLQPEFTAIGLEVLKLMDERLYNYEK